MESKIDIVIPLGNGSTWEDNELKYCLRSIEKYLKNYGKIWIVCDEIPKFLTKRTEDVIEYLYYPNEEVTPSMNIFHKLEVASEYIHGNFLYFNDDYFLTKEVDASKIPYFHSGAMLDSITGNNNWYDEYLKKTNSYLNNNILQSRRYDDLENKNYDIHYPMIMNSNKILELTQQLDLAWDEYDCKLLIKSIYANTYNVTPSQEIQDCKIRNLQSTHYVKDFIKDKFMFSTGDRCLTEPVRKLIEDMYPQKSKFEV